MLGYIAAVRVKYIRCRELFANYVVNYTGKLQGTAFNKYELILRFLVQSEMSYIIREHAFKMFKREILFEIGFSVATGEFSCVGGVSVMDSFMRRILDELDSLPPEQIVLDLTMEEELVNMAFGC